MEFARRSRKLYAQREAVVDGELRLTYAQFFERCDRASAALSKLGIGKGDRVATIAPNTVAHLEQFYAVPQLGAVVVPLNYRLIAEDFVYLINHSGARMVCAHSDYLDMVEGIRARCPKVEHFVALEGAKTGWLNYESLLAQAGTEFPRAEVAESDLLAINYTSGTTAKPKGVMITHRNAWVNAVGTLIHHPMSTADRYLWTLPMFHANGWTFVWVVTAAGATHVCLRKVEPAAVYERVKGERITMFCAAPTVLIGVANAPAEMRRNTPRGLRVMTAGAPPSAATIERVEQDLGWTITHVYGLTETAPFITINEPRPEFAELSPEKHATQKARHPVHGTPLPLKSSPFYESGLRSRTRSSLASHTSVRWTARRSAGESAPSRSALLHSRCRSSSVKSASRVSGRQINARANAFMNKLVRS